jgi:hypothetical protein
LNWVWRWANGLRSAERPPIHMRDGENVCIHRTSPAHCGDWFASRHTARMASDVVSTDLNTSGTGRAPDALSARVIVLELSATSFSGPGP